MTVFWSLQPADRCTAAMATMQFAMGDIVADFLLRYPTVNIVAHATDRNVDIVMRDHAAVKGMQRAELARRTGSNL